MLAFLAGRMAVTPLGALEPDFRRLSGRVLSLGCGHGIVDRYIAELNSNVEIEGVELNAKRVKLAGESQQRAPRVHLRVQDVTTLHESDVYDAALAFDVMHHVPYGEHARIAESLWRCLRPGALCLVKDMARTPKLQHSWNRLHDRLSAGPEPIHCRDPEDMGQVFAGVGFAVEGSRRMTRFGLYPHYLVSLRKP